MKISNLITLAFCLSTLIIYPGKEKERYLQRQKERENKHTPAFITPKQKKDILKQETANRKLAHSLNKSDNRQGNTSNS